MKTIWSRRALLDVEHIRDYIAQDSPAYAQPFIERLLHTTCHLPRFPHSGRPMPKADNPGIREVIYQGYRIIYRPSPGIIEIVMVVHGTLICTGLISVDFRRHGNSIRPWSDPGIFNSGFKRPGRDIREIWGAVSLVAGCGRSPSWVEQD